MFCSKCGKQLPDGSKFCSGCGKKFGESFVKNSGTPSKVMPNIPLYSFGGARGRHIEVFENKCVIKTNVTLGSLITGNVTDGEKTIYYQDCIGIQFKEVGWLLGYLQIETSTSMMDKKHDNFFCENTFTFGKKLIMSDGKKEVANEKMREITNYIKSRLDEIKTKGYSPSIVQFISPAEELKKMKELLDMGIITQEEFDAKKKQLLGL